MDLSESASRSNQKAAPQLRAGLIDRLAGEKDDFAENLKPYLPSDLIGGSVPHVVGTEEEAVWNAASQACATEKVNFVYSVADGRCWYLACPSASLASNPDSWCPIAAALPGNSEYWDRDTVYLYEQEGLASGLRWDPDTGRMQIFVGAARTLLPKLQSMNANFVTINAEGIPQIPWRNRALKTEKLSRATARILLTSGILANVVIAFFLGLQFFLTSVTMGSLEKVRSQTEQASQQLIEKSYMTMQNDIARHMARISEINGIIFSNDGRFLMYSFKDGKVEWSAAIPPAFQNQIQPLGGQVQPGYDAEGRVTVKGTR